MSSGSEATTTVVLPQFATLKTGFSGAPPSAGEMHAAFTPSSAHLRSRCPSALSKPEMARSGVSSVSPDASSRVCSTRFSQGARIAANSDRAFEHPCRSERSLGRVRSQRRQGRYGGRRNSHVGRSVPTVVAFSTAPHLRVAFRPSQRKSLEPPQRHGQKPKTGDRNTGTGPLIPDPAIRGNLGLDCMISETPKTGLKVPNRNTSLSGRACRFPALRAG